MNGLLVALALMCSSLVHCTSAQLQRREKIFITAPNILRVGVNETVTATVFNTGDDEAVAITIYLEKREGGIAAPYSSTTIRVQKGSPVTTTVRVNPSSVSLSVDSYIYLIATAPSVGFREEKEILVSSRAGYLLLQTDKPIYTPNQEVKIRMVAVDQEMKPSSELIHMMILNPQGIIVEQFRETRAVNGFLDNTFQFNAEPMFGNWSVTVLHGLQFQKNKTIQFEVRKYVLPKFTIKINTPEYILKSMEVVDINFEAKYVYKKPVEGSFHMVIGVKRRDGSVVAKQERSGVLDNGIGAYILVPEGAYGPGWFDLYEGSRLHVEVMVTEISTGVTERAVDISTPIVQSGYRFKTGQTVQYFKPGLPYELQFELETVMGQPAQHMSVNIDVYASTPTSGLALYNTEDPSSSRQMTDINGRVKFVFNTTHDFSQINVWVSSDGPNQEENAEFIFTANPYQSPVEDNYLSIQIDHTMLRVGDEVYAIIHNTGRGLINNLNLLFVAQGRVVLAKTVDHVILNPERVFFRVEADMVPIVRVVAYYINQQNYVVADSIALKVENACKHYVGLNIQESPDEDDSYLPESPVTLLVDAYPTSYVGLLGVDKAVYALNNNHLLTRKKMFEMMQSYDVGCGPGGGPTTPIIFKDSGLTVLTNAQLSVPPREGLACTTPASRRRRQALPDQVNPVVGVCLARLEASCEDNLTKNPPMANRIQRWKTCEKIAAKLSLLCPSASASDEKVFRDCCNNLLRTEDRFRSGLNSGRDLAVPVLGVEMPFPASEVEIDIDLRTDFRETWLFDLIHIGQTGREEITLVTPGSITEWSLQAVSVTPTGGLCITDPLNVNVFKSLSVQLRLPYSVVRMEQIEIVATVYNYNSQSTEVTVEFYNPRGCCGESTDPSAPAQRVVMVDGNDSQSLKFVIIPLEIGDLPIVVRATSDIGNDGVRRTLTVIPQGSPVSIDHAVLLDPSGIYRHHRQSPRMRAAVLEDIQSDQVIDVENSMQYNVLELVPPEGIIPGTESAHVTLIGNMLGPILVDPIEHFGDWLQLPRGCGEQTMSIVAPTIFVVKYLKTMQRMNDTLEDHAMDRISRGLASALAHRREDGSFSIWGDNEKYNSSTWLTSFVLKVFSHADQLTAVDRMVTCKAAEWLVANAQNPNGSFSELYQVHHKEMTGGLSGEASMTAYVLISLLEGHWCDELDVDLDQAIRHAKVFLERQLEHVTRPYARAIVTYALALAKSDYASGSNSRLRSASINNPVDGSRHWRPEEVDPTDESLPNWYHYRPSAVSVETTGYALLAQLALGEVNYAGSVALWLSEQQNYEGGFISTQDTVIALQALIKYSDMATSGEDIDLHCELTSDADPSFHFQHHFLPHNALVQRSIQVPVGGRLRSECSGKGTGKLSVRMKFHREPDSSETCPFQVMYNAQEARSGFNPALAVATNPRSRVAILPRSAATSAQMARSKGDFVHTIRFCARYTENTRSNMGIIDVGLYSGFVLVEDRLEDMVQTDHLHLVQRFEVTQRSVIFYLDRIPADQNICIEFNARREMLVGNIQPVAVRVYDYYSPDKSCTSFYHPLSGNTNLPTLCNDQDQCICPRERCSMCSSTRESLNNLMPRACMSDEHFALKVMVEGRETANGYVVYTGNVTTVLKQGVDPVLPGHLRHFYVREQCGCPQLRLRHEYTIVGSAGLGFITDTGEQGYKYLLDDQSISVLWPTKTGSRRRKILETMNRLQDFDREITRGCQ